mgnify:CR=1 FL=1
MIRRHRLNFKSTIRLLFTAGILLINGPVCDTTNAEGDADLLRLCSYYESDHPINTFPLIIVVDDSDFCSATLNNWLWVTFTRSNPATDLYGIAAWNRNKHWGCDGSVIIDARIKPHHAPPLIDDPHIEQQVDELGAAGGPLHGII